MAPLLDAVPALPTPPAWLWWRCPTCGGLTAAVPVPRSMVPRSTQRTELGAVPT